MTSRLLALLAAVCFLAPVSRVEAMASLRQYFTPPEEDAAPAPASNWDATPQPSPESTPTPEATPPAKASIPVVRVNVTSQAYNFSQPWRKRQPALRQGLGVVLLDGRILVTAELVANHTYVELEKPETALKIPAKVEVVDYDANLALLAAPGADFLQSIPGAKLDNDIAIGDHVEILQLEPNGTPVRTAATVTTIEVNSYPVDENAFLVFKLSLPLQSRENSFTVPAFRDGKLVGLLMRYDPRSQTADVVPSPVIAHFLEAAAQSPYAGFPRIGLSFADTRDPQLRRFAKLPDGKGGAYVTKITRNSPAEKAGIKVGDVLLSLDGNTIDQDGNYEDSKFGKISLAHYVSTVLQSKKTIPIVVWRDGAELTLEGTLEPRDRASMISEPYIFDAPPNFLIAGGIIFSELSRQYLREWGPRWTSEAPLRLVYLDRYQNELPADQGNIVFISGVLSTPNTIGYQDLAYQIVESVNGKPIHNLHDLAAAIDGSTDRYIRIKLSEDPGLIVLDAEASKAEEARIQQEYGLPILRHLNEQN